MLQHQPSRRLANEANSNVALRALYLYPMVLGPDGEPTPLRAMTPHRVLVHAPPGIWGWGVDPVERQVVTQANPAASTAMRK